MPSTPVFANNTSAASSSANLIGPASAAPSSLATVSKGKQAPLAAIPSGPSNSAVGPSQNAMSTSASPVNGKPVTPHAAPIMGGPAIINSSVANGTANAGDHSRKPSSVTISAQGTSGSLPNGTAAAPSARPPINFGNFDNASSPAPSHSVPQQGTPNSLSASIHNPASQARSPSPIPPPATASGGRPPSLQNQNILNFGSLAGADGSDANLRPGAIPQGGANQIGQPQHLRRESSQSAHSDMSPSLNRNFPNGRGRGFTQQYPNNMHGSPMNRPNAPYRQPSNVPPFQPQAGMRGPGSSPYAANRSPAIAPATMHQQQGFYPNGAPMQQHGAYPYPQQYSAGNQPQNMYGMPNQLDPNFQGMYYPGQYGMHQGMPNMQGMPYPGAPASPGPFRASQSGYMPGYNPGQSMSRQSSQNPERPASTVSNAAPSTTPSVPAPAATPSITSPAAQAPSFQPRKPRESKAIAIMRPDGGGPVVIDKKALTSPPPSTPVNATPTPPAPAKGPVVIASGSGLGTPSSSTPPPRPAATAPVHIRSDSTHMKTADERKAEFTQQFKKLLEAEQGKKDDGATREEPSEKAKADAEVLVAEEKKVAAAAEEQIKKADPAATATEDDDAEKARKEAEEKKRLEKEEEERMIAELEAMEREEEERERQYQEKQKQKKEEQARKEAEAKANLDEELRRQEREAEAREEAREKAAKDGAKDTDDESAKLFASLKRPTLGPGANAADESGASTPATAGSPTLPPTQPKNAAGAAAGKSKPGPLKLDTNKPVEPAQPTAGMQSLKAARFLTVSDAIEYPSGINSPNPALNPSANGKGMKYDTDFLLQFQKVFSEKPSIDWDTTMKNTVGDTSDSARPQSARTPSMAGRQNSNRPAMGAGSVMGPPMGSFGANASRTLPVGTTSEQRFNASQRGGPPNNPFGAGFSGRPGGFPMGAPMMSRSGSSQNMAQGMGSGRNASQRGGKGSRRGPPPAEEAKLAKTMPLTAGQDLKPLEVSRSGWKASSLGGAAATNTLPGGHLPPDVVQRKVKASLNKMTPEKFDKISDDILNIAMQSKDEQDGRTLRQVIQLTFEKACDEAHWASMYAKFCKRMLETMSPEIKDENVRDKTGTPVVGGALFRKYLLNRCQEEFERGWEINLPEKPEGESEAAAMLSEDYYIAAAAKRRGLGLIQFIGELYKLDMLTIRIMHECVVRLLQFEGLPDESAVESLVKLLRTVGGKMETAANGGAMLGTYFDRVKTVMEMQGLPSRLYYMLLDTVELRNKNWRSKDDQKGPKTIQEIREDALAAQTAAEAERQRQNARGGRPPIGRGDARAFSGGGMPPPDYPRNQVGMDDLKKLAARGARQSSTGPGGNFGPAQMLGSRSSSGRRGGLGPLARGADDSGASSRQGTPPVKEKESGPAHSNAFSALAALEAEGEDGASPSPASSPPVAKATPAIASALEDSKEPKA